MKTVLQLTTLILLLGAATPASAQEDAITGMMKRVGFDQNLNAQVPLDLPLRDESGRLIRLGDLLGKKPAILNLVYYECPMLCNEVLNSLLRSLNALTFDVGKEFDVITVSIDPKETYTAAARKKGLYLARYGRPGAEKGWHFLTGEGDSVAKLAKIVGFRYEFDAKSGQYAHPAGVMILTPQGKLSRYIYGISYPARDLRLGVMDAAMQKIGSPIDQLLLLCFHYDPRTGRYNLAAMNVIRLLGVATAGSLGAFMGLMLWRDRRKPALNDVSDLPLH